uniref:Uncharacterized protein n=1 Tax=Solanum lycopersicum TaxID=4081 RepID=K4AU39_SOLLC
MDFKLHEFKCKTLIEFVLKQNQLEGAIKISLIDQKLLNRFEGHIPSIIVYLVGLRTLNLSHNSLEGHIPASQHQLSVLESLDLSSNKISGEIPQQLASLTSLEVLKRSHNHLTIILLDDCRGDDKVLQTTTPVDLDQEGGGDSSMISWKAVLLGYCCRLFIGLSKIYIMLSTQYPTWFSKDGFKIGTQNYYNNEKSQETILVIVTSKYSV